MDGERLILFDIDGTLLRTQGAGMAAMIEALSRLFPAQRFSFDSIPVAGRLDTLIWRDLAERHGIPDEPSVHARFRATYAECLRAKLDSAPGSTRVMPGVPVLLDALRGRPGVHLGLLTGNYSETGTLKIRHSGLDHTLFKVNAWAEDGESRRALPPVAIRRFHEQHGRPMDPERVVIIGDTPHDVDCALATGCRVLGVATGEFPRDTLAEHGAHMALNALDDTGAVVEWLLNSSH